MKAEEKMCQGSCSVSLSFDHRSTHTGASDHEIAVTCSEFAKLYQRCRSALSYLLHARNRSKLNSYILLIHCLYVPEMNLSTCQSNDREENLEEEQSIEQLGLAFHTPGHIFTCVERSSGLGERQGHTELSVAVARAAGVTPIMVGTVVLNKEVRIPSWYRRRLQEAMLVFVGVLPVRTS